MHPALTKASLLLQKTFSTLKTHTHTPFHFLPTGLRSAILYDHMIMYVGLFGHSAVVFHVLMFFRVFFVFY